MLEDLRRDVAYGLRSLRRAPGFTTVAVLTLALGIGAVTVIYSVVRNVVLDPFPYKNSDRLVNVVLRDDGGRIVRGPYFPAPEFLDYQEQTTVFEDVVGTSQEGAHMVHAGGAERISINWMTPNGFDFLGVPPLVGRAFAPTDAAPGAPPIAVLNHRAWMTMFGGDPGVVGRDVIVDGVQRTIVGIMPPRFEWNVADLWLPAALTRGDDPKSNRGVRAFQAHLRPGVTVAEAEAQLNVVAARRAAAKLSEYPPRIRMMVIPVVDWVVRDFRGVLYTLFGAVALLLVIACCNVANLLLARATTREREISIRAAIGASRGRIVRQLLVENALLALGGLVAGSLLAYSGVTALAAFMPRQGVPWETQLRLDRPVLLFAIIVAAGATLAFGLFPALQSVRRDLLSGASLGARGTAGRRQTRMRNGLVVAQVALSIVLLLGAGLLMRTFVHLAQADPGFDPKNLLFAGVVFPPRESASAQDHARRSRQILERVQAIAGVRSASLSSNAPGFPGMQTTLRVPGRDLPQPPTGFVVFASEQFVDTAGYTVLRGRFLSTADVTQARRVTVVNETLARTHFGGGDAIGRTIRFDRLATLPSPVVDPTFEIVGIARDVNNVGPREPPAAQAFVPITLRGPSPFLLVLRTTDHPLGRLAAVREEVRRVDAQAALIQPETMEGALSRNFRERPRFSVLVLGIFACAGVGLVGFGVYGVLAYSVSQQSREIAIRMALGSGQAHVLRMVMGLGLKLVGVGLAVGLAAGLATNRLLTTELWRTSPHDPVTLVAATAVVVVVGVCACLVPARRAIRVEPMTALRHE